VPADAWRLIDEEIFARFMVRDLPDDRRRPFLVTDNLRHFIGLRRHGIAVMTAAQFAETLTASGS
jgi:hypothetical protein